jgi:hypothetical protein
LIYRIIPPISPHTRHIRGDTAGAGGRGYVYSPEGEGVIGGLWGTVIGYATLSGMLCTSPMLINKVIHTPDVYIMLINKVTNIICVLLQWQVKLLTSPCHYQEGVIIRGL